MLTLLSLLVVVIGVIAYVVSPLLRKTTSLTAKSIDERLRELEEQKETLYDVIKEVEFDYQMQKLSDEDYTDLRDQLRREAADILQQIESHRTS